MDDIHKAALDNNLHFFEDHHLPKKIVNLAGGMYLSSPIQFALYNENYKIILFLLLNDANTNHLNLKKYDIFSIIYKYDYVLAYILFESHSVKSVKKKKGKRILLLFYRKQLYNDILCNKHILIIYTSLFYRENIRSPYFLYLNIIYSLELYCSNLFYIYVLYWITFLYLMFYKNDRVIQQNCRELIVDLILSDKYNLDTFCYICKNIKDNHCTICDRCIKYRHHHCIFLNNCVSVKNLVIFYLYIILYLIILTYNFFKRHDIIEKGECGLIALIILLNI